MSEQLTREEFLVHVGYLSKNLEDIKEHLATLNGKTQKNTMDIAVLQDRDSEDRREAKSAGAVWGGGVGAVLVGAFETAKWLLGK